MIFWLATIVITFGALVLLWPAFKPGAGAAPRVHDARLAVYRDRRRELDAERTSGSIDDTRYAEAMRELEDTAAEDLAGDADAAERGGSGRIVFIAIALSVPLMAYGLYALLGAQDELRAHATASDVPHDMRELVDRLDARMQQTPDDLEGWMMLGRSRMRLGEYDAAAAAWREAQRLAPDNPTVLANLGEALILDDPSTLGGDAGVMIEQALASDPENPKALWYGGLYAEHRGDAGLAAERWRKLLALDPPPELIPVIEYRLESVEDPSR